MGKRSNLYEIYFGPIGGFSAYDSLKNGPRGSMHSTGDPLTLDAEFGVSDIDEEEFEEDDFDVLSKVRQSMSVSPVDKGRSNPQNTSYDNIGYAYPMVSALTEKAALHTTTMMKGAIPNATYRNSTGGKSTKTSFNSTSYPKFFIKPRSDMDATYYGTSRKPLPRHDELEDENIWSLNDMIDQHELALIKHTKNINKLRESINNIN